MLLIFKLQNGTEKKFNIQNLVYDNHIDVCFSTIKVKEIAFVNNINRSNDKDLIKNLYEKIKEEIPDYTEIIETILQFNDNVSYNFNIKIKEFIYKIQSYLSSKEYTLQECFHIRFEEDDVYRIDFEKGIIFCGKNDCPYYINNFCKKYNQNIDKSGIICKSCYLESYQTIINKFINPIYKNMQKKLNINI